MKAPRAAAWLTLFVLLFTSPGQAADGRSAGSEDVVRRYFKEVVDGRNTAVLEEIIQPDCIMHRPETALKGLQEVRAFFERSRQTHAEIQSHIHDVIVSGDRVVIRLSHRAIGAGTFRSRLGMHDVKGKTYSWDAIAIFRIKDGKIAEEWVNRDELAILLNIGALEKKQ